jgi:glycosyltransferase involved in cell wall biosynthesis
MGESNCSLLVFSDDWGRHPSSCQHLVRHLLGAHPVCWVNTIGTRVPRLNHATLRRGLEKLRHWVSARDGPDEHPANPRVVNPRMWPSFGSRFGRALNRWLLGRQLTPVVRSLARPLVGVTTIPVVADLVGLLPVDRWVYYCVDDFSQWPGLDQATMRRMEERLIDRVDDVIAVSETLQQRVARRGRTARLLTHGIDPDFWRGEQTGEPPPGLDGLERPLVVFWGVTDRRTDVDFVRQLAGDMKGGTVLLVGPEEDPDPTLYGPKRVVHLPPLPYGQLPRLAAEAAVLIMPYADLPVTRAMQPLKLKEFLATGKPVVVRDLPATRPWADCLDLADTPLSFSEAVRLRLETGLPEHQEQGRARLAGESWAEKASLFKRWVCNAG